MKLNQLRALITVAKAGSIREAAMQMHLTQPALSKSIRELEREMGVELLIRNARGTTLTPYGAAVVKRSKAVDNEISKMREEVNSLKGASGGRLSIGFTPPAAGEPLADAISALRSLRPGLDLQLLELRPGQITDGLRDGSLDIGVISRYGQPSLGNFDWQPLYELETLLACSGSHPDKTVSIATLRKEEWLMLDASDDLNGYVSTLFSYFNLPLPTRTVRCSSIYLYLQLALRIDVVTHWIETAFPTLDKHFAAGTMTRIALEEPMPRLGIYLGYQDEQLLTAIAAEFVELLNKQASKRREQGRRSA